MADITNIRIEFLHPHPSNPRKDLGDLAELAESIRAKGILQNLTVVPMVLVDPDATITMGDGHYTILIGHRRFAAAKLAGLTELPCAIVEMDQKEQLQTMLIENMQRSDLTVYEQAQGFQMMLDLGSTVEEIAEKSGFSATTVRRRVKMMELDQEKLKEVSGRQLSLADFDRLAQIEDLEARNQALDKIGTNNFDAEISKAISKQKVAKNRPDVKAWLESVKAKAIKDSDRWSNKYDSVGTYIWLEKWKEDSRNSPPKELPDELFYYLDSNSLNLYKKHEKAKPVEKTPEEKAETKAINEAQKVVIEASRKAYDLRKQFVEGLSVTNKNRDAVMKGLIAAACLEAIDYNSPDRDTLNAILDLPTGYSSDRSEKMAKAVEDLKTSDTAKLVYAFFGDSEKVNCNDSYRFPIYKLNIKLNMIYNWLVSLGYELSTEEMQMLNGEHEVYSRGEKYYE